MIPRCCATQQTGHLCTVIIGPTEVRCRRHQNVLNKKGPRKFITDEARFRMNRMRRALMLIRVEDVGAHIEIYDRIFAWYYIATDVFRALTDQAISDTLLIHRGPWYIRGHVEPINEFGQVILPPPPPAPVQRPLGRELEDFSGDKQNVHRKTTVDQTIEIVKRVLKIPVPENYRWNTETLSKTPGEIIVACKLTPKAGMMMMDKYSHDDDVYELGKGIYGKVLDSVWQYISKSNDKESMCVILRQELQDNIGMCAQGNLSRLCNALAGYMEGIEDIESVSEKLGRLIPPLMNIENETERIERAKNILQDIQLPTEEWNDWLDALK